MIQVHKMHLSVADAQLQAWLNSLSVQSEIIAVTAVGDFWVVVTRT